MPNCLFCHAPISSDLIQLNLRFCISCSMLLDEPGVRHACGVSLFSYQGYFRELILKTKVAKDHQLLPALVDLCLEHPYTKEEVARCEVIMPVPSSFWGRMRGGIDIAYFIARECAYQFGKRMRLAPFGSHWRIFKRSMQTQRLAMRLNFPRRRDCIPTLLIDDVITTGFSLLQLAYKLENSQCRFLTLGNAYSTREDQLD